MTEVILRKQMFPRLRPQEAFVAEAKFTSREEKNVSEFVQKHFASSANVSSFARRGSISGNNVSATMHVSSFAGALSFNHI